MIQLIAIITHGRAHFYFINIIIIVIIVSCGHGIVVFLYHFLCFFVFFGAYTQEPGGQAILQVCCQSGIEWQEFEIISSACITNSMYYIYLYIRKGVKTENKYLT